MRIVYIIGTDGAGKTTLARRLADQWRSSGWRYAYCQAAPLILRPFRWFARRRWLSHTDEFADYATFADRKQDAVRSRPALARLYSWLWYVDLLLRAWPRLARARLSGHDLVLDRYYLDIVVNQGVLQANDVRGMLRDARLLERVLPRPDVFVLLDVSTERAFSRKNDIQSVQYLEERRKRYLELAEHYRFEIVNADASADEVYAEAVSRIARLMDAGVHVPAAGEARCR